MARRVEVFEKVLTDTPDCTIYCCGPVQSLGAYLEKHHSYDNLMTNRLTMQGGFIGYNVHGKDVERLDKFEGQDTVATFNLGGSKTGSLMLMELVSQPTFIGKNLCHTIRYDLHVHSGLSREAALQKPYALFKKLMDAYLEVQQEKVMHDVIAAVGHLHPEFFDFYHGEIYREMGMYGTRPCDPPRHHVAIDVDRQKLWSSIRNGI